MFYINLETPENIYIVQYIIQTYMKDYSNILMAKLI